MKLKFDSKELSDMVAAKAAPYYRKMNADHPHGATYSMVWMWAAGHVAVEVEYTEEHTPTQTLRT